MQDDEATLPNMLLGRYRVEGMLGEGGLGKVVKAFDTRLKRMVAIKTLKRASYTTDPDQFRALEERFAREAEAGSRMGSHPNIVGVHDLIIDEERTQYLILEYLPGGNLAERIARGPIPLADMLLLVTEIARGLQAAHGMGLVHRDIKPANVFLTADERAKIGDFGIAQIDDVSGRTRVTSGHPGTPLYMSPEQERMTTYLRPASDQYSLGLVAFELITGQIYKRIGSRQGAHLLAAQAAPVQSLITKMLVDDPDDRYPSMEEVIHALRAIERHIASAETRIQMRVGSEMALSHDDEQELAVTRHDTPRVGLQPMPPVAIYAPPPALPSAPRYSRRAMLIGAGGLVLAAGTAGVAMTNLRNSGATVATATLPVATLVAAVSTVQPTTPPTISPIATSAPPIVVTVPPAAPIIITVPPIIITATPLPAPAATPTPLPTAAPPPTATPAPVRQAQFVTWIDRQGRTRMAYPADWRVVPLTGQDQVFEIDSGDGVDFTVYISNNVQNDSALSGITAYRDRQSKRTDRSYTFGALMVGTLGGVSSESMTFTSTSRQNPSDIRTAEVDYAVNGGWIFAFEFFTQGTAWRHLDELQSMLRSLSFG